MNKLPRQRKRKRGDKGILDSASSGNVEPPCEIEVKRLNNIVLLYVLCLLTFECVFYKNKINIFRSISRRRN
jgi:hypothetical protein